MKFSPVTLGMTLLILAAVVAIPWAQPDASKPGLVEFALLNEENWREFAPAGKEVDAIYGDYVLRNDRLVAVIAQPKDSRNANMTVRQVGGALIDLTVRSTPSDQLSAFYPGKRNYKYLSARLSGRHSQQGAFQLEIPTDGSLQQTGETLSLSMTAEGGEARPKVVTTYSLAAGETFLTVTTSYSNLGAAPLTIDLEDDLRLDAGKEDLPKSPNGESRSFWAYDRHWGQAYAVLPVKDDSLSGVMIMNSDARVSTLKYQTADNKASIVLAPGESREISRRLYAADDLLNLHALTNPDPGGNLAKVRLSVTDGDQQPVARGLVELIAESGQSYGSARLSAEGTLAASLPPGTYAVRISALGQRLDQDDLRITVGKQANQFDLNFAGYRVGKLEGTITDAAGNPLPCKVELRPVNKTPLDFGPETADFAVRNLRYTPNGKFTQVLPTGDYEVLISHGPEFDLAEQRLTVSAGKTAPLTATLNRSVNTAGWVSSDFHSHSSPSGDNTGSQLGRVLNLAAEHIEFAPCTEHNRVDTYEPHLEQLGLRNFLATVSGMELTGTPLPLNHQNVFPMKFTPHAQDGGGPVTADNLEDQIERLALWDDRSEKLLQVNHPDLGWMFYDKNGDGTPDSGFERAVPFMDVVEIHPIDSALRLGPVREFASGQKNHNVIFRWLQLLNQGYRIYGVVNTDAHYNYHGSGWLRNWIQSSTDEPAQIDPLEMVHAAEQGRLVMSNGPFLEVWANEPGQSTRVTSGQELTAKGKHVSLKVKVQCPNWLDVNRVFVLVNGRPDPRHDYSREKTPAIFRSGVVKFDETLDVELARDAHLIVVAGQSGGDLTKVMGPQYGKQEPAALTNPIYVDLEGDGFQPSKDTLDHPLPVKFGAGK